MSSLKVAVFVCTFGAVIPGAFLGCAAGPSATGDAVQEPPAPGEEAGTYLLDGTCSQGLECLDGVCVAAEGEGNGEGEAEGEGAAQVEDEAEDEGAGAQEGQGDGQDDAEDQAQDEAQGEGEDDQESEGELEDEVEGEAEGEGEGEAEEEGEGEDEGEGDTLLIFHNNRGPMCLEALDWLDSVKSEHPALVIEEHLTYEAGEIELLLQLEAQFQTSQGVSMSFEYLPIVFFQRQAFSGFNDQVADALQELLLSIASASRWRGESGGVS